MGAGRGGGREGAGEAAGDRKRPHRARRIQHGREPGPGLLHGLPGMVYQSRAEPDWPMEFVSPGAAGLTGHPPTDFLEEDGLPFGELIDPEDRDRVWNEVLAAVEADEAFSIEYRITHAAGETRHVWDHGRGVFDVEGELLGVEGIILDVTERVRLTEQLRDAQRREAIGRLTGVVAHDFNNYLTVIIGSLELAREDLDPGSVATESVGRAGPGPRLAARAARKARDLTRQLLLVGKGRAQKRELMDLNRHLRGTHALLAQLVGSPVRLQLDLHGGPLWLNADPALVEQVLLNLVVNAREAIDGYGTISIRSAPGRDQERSTAVLEVEDDGCGMEEEIRRRIFDPFFTTKSSGTGLGLATVREIVSELDGTLHLRTEPGGGSTFSVHLPTVAEGRLGEGKAPEPSREKSLSRGGGETVVVVDDEETVLGLMTRVLSRFGYRVVGAGTPEECRRVVAALGEPPDLLVMDVTLPGMNGMELAGELREAGYHAPVLFMSGYAPEEVITGAESLRDTFYLEKPFSVDELLDAVARRLREGRGGGQARGKAG